MFTRKPVPWWRPWVRTLLICVALLAFLGSLPPMFIYTSRWGWWDPNPAGKVMVVYSMHDHPPFVMKQGLFSDFMSVLGAVQFGLEHNAAAVRVVFDTDIYVEPERGPNWWSYFFDHVIVLDPEQYNALRPRRVMLPSHNTANRVDTDGKVHEGYTIVPSNAVIQSGRVSAYDFVNEPFCVLGSGVTERVDVNSETLFGYSFSDVENKALRGQKGVISACEEVPSPDARKDLALYSIHPRSSELHVNGWLGRFGKLGSFAPYVIGPRKTKDRPYPLDPVVPLDRIRHLLRNYIHFKPFILEKAMNVYNHMVGLPDVSLKTAVDLGSLRTAVTKPVSGHGLYTIGIHYRGTDKVLIYPYKSPNPKIYDHYIEQVILKYGDEIKRRMKANPDAPAPTENPEEPDWIRGYNLRIFVATDQTEFADYMRKRYGERVYLYDGSPRLSKDDIEGIQGGTHKSTKFSPYIKAESVIIDALVMSFCDYIIKNRSSVSDVSVLMKEVGFTQWTFYPGPGLKPVSFDGLKAPSQALIDE